MPIYDQSYAHWKGRLEGHIFRWLPITANGIRHQFKSKRFLIFFILGLVPFILRTGMIVAFGYVEQLRSELDMMEAENQRLQDKVESEDFINGALAVLLGVIITLVVPRLWPKRRKSSSWA